jgi:hypothetical protein
VRWSGDFLCPEEDRVIVHCGHVLPLVSESAPLPHPDFPTFYNPLRKTQMMNKTITSLSFASLLAMASFFALAAETTSPPTTIPGVNQAQAAESNEEKANKKGEEAAGSNSGADAQSLEKEAASSSDSKDLEKTK